MPRTKKKRAQRSRHPLAILVIAVLAVIVGVRIVKVYMDLGEAKEQEQALARQQEQLAEENESLREDLEKKDDEEFIKSLARGLGWYEDGSRLFVDPNR